MGAKELIIYNNSFIADKWSIQQTKSNNTGEQKIVSHSALQNRCLHMTNTRSKAL